jgi:serine/threonine protein kinase
VKRRHAEISINDMLELWIWMADSACLGRMHLVMENGVKYAVLQGKYPDGLKLVEDDELRDFIQLCISHTPDARPDTRKLLKHSFFEGCRGKSSDTAKLDVDPQPDISTLLGPHLFCQSECGSSCCSLVAH